MGNFTCLICSICLPESIKLVGTSCAKLSLTESRIQVAVIMQTSQTFAIKSKVRLRATGNYLTCVKDGHGKMQNDFDQQSIFNPFNFLFQTKHKFFKHFSWKPVKRYTRFSWGWDRGETGDIIIIPDKVLFNKMNSFRTLLKTLSKLIQMKREFP